MNRYFRSKISLILLVTSVLVASFGVQYIQADSPAQNELDAVWQRVERAGAYGFTADIIQTRTPLPTVTNAGRGSKRSSLYLEGKSDLKHEMLDLTLWSGSGSALDMSSGMQVRIDGETAMARKGAGAWEEIEDFTGLFAPGGDFTAYARAAKNVVRHPTENRTTVLGEIAITRYSFDVDGQRFAEQMVDAMRDQAIRDGLPASVHVDLPRMYTEMTGTGELWIGENGLPLHQEFTLRFPESKHKVITSAEIAVDFSDFAPIQKSVLPNIFFGLKRDFGHGITLELTDSDAVSNGLSLTAFLVAVAGLFLVLHRRRSLMVYRAIVFTVSLSMVSVPLLNNRRVYAYSEQQRRQEVRQDAEQAKVEARDAIQRRLNSPTVAPHLDPLASANQHVQLAQLAQVDDPTDEETYDGRYFDASCEQDPDGDMDGDTLTNLEECLLGTLPEEADTDQDGVDDNVEVAGFQLPGSSVMWYTDPTELDTNKDGLGDGQEWYTDADGNQQPDDTDGDGVPDLWDEDNDGDAVPDGLDMSAYVQTKDVKTFSQENPFQLTLNNLVADNLVKVEFQLKPLDANHLWYAHNVLDWPVNDRQGHLQDADGLTFFDLDDSLSPSPNENGDMRMVPLLKIEIPLTSPNLPPAGTCTDDAGESFDCYPLLDQFGISTHEISESLLAAYVPLQLVGDGNGDENVAFYGRMVYQADGAWQDAHTVRLVWGIQMLNDVCAEFDDGICTEYSEYNDLQIVQTYYDDWYLTGLMATEDRGTDIALVYEDPVATAAVQAGYDAPFYLDTLYALLYGLDVSFLAGRDCNSTDAEGNCVGDGQRDITVAEIERRFDASSNGGISEEERWGLPNVLGVEQNRYASVDLGLFDTTITQTVQLLDDVYTDVWSAAEPITPTIMMASEEDFRALNLDEFASNNPNLSWSANTLAIDLAQTGDNTVEVETIATVKWTPYSYDPAAGWASAEMNDFLHAMETGLDDSFEDLTEPDEVDTYKTVSQALYMTVYNGNSFNVQIGTVIESADYSLPDLALENTLAKGAGRLLITGLQQYFKFGEALKQAADLVRNAEWYFNRFDTPASKFLEIQIARYGHGVVAFAALAFTALAVLVLATVLIVKVAGQDQWGGWDILGGSALLTMTLILGIITPILSAIQAAKTAAGVIQWGAFLSKITTINKLKSAASYAAIIGLIISVFIALGIFIWAWASGKVNPGTVAFNTLIAATIAAIIIAIIFFVIALTVVGAIILSIIVFIDTILLLAGVDFSITGFFAEIFTFMIYRFSITEPTVTAGSLGAQLQDPNAGYQSGNQISYSMPITTSIDTLGPPGDRALAGSITYDLDSQEKKTSTSVNARKDDWTIGSVPMPPFLFWTAEIVDEPSHTTTLAAGANRPINLYLNSAYALLGRECWLLFFCKDRTVAGNVSDFIADVYVSDVLPATLDEFVDVGEWGGRPERDVIGSVRFLDPDGDGLLDPKDGGLDPNNQAWDTDGDGLADDYEFFLRSQPVIEGGVGIDPESADSDGDGVNDGLELRFGMDPTSSDSDGDGLSDPVELMPSGGWNLPFRYDAASRQTTTTRVWSDPLLPDADGDGLSDLFEQTQLTCPTCDPWADPDNPAIFHPGVWNESPVALYIEDDSVDGFATPDATVVYTTTTQNNLGSGQELVGELSLDLPAAVNGGPLSMPVNISNGESASLVSELTFASQESAAYDLTSGMELTNFFETRWSWDAPNSVSNGIVRNDLLGLAATSVEGWSGAHLIVTRERDSFYDAIVAYVIDGDGTVVETRELRSPLTLFALSDPDVACNKAGICLVVWGNYAPNISGGTSAFTIFQFNGNLANSQRFTLLPGVSSHMPFLSASVASDGTDFLAAWSRQRSDGNGATRIEYAPIAVNAGPGAINELVRPDGSQAVAAAWNGTDYTLAWTGGNEVSWRSVALDGGLPDDTVYSVAGDGWPKTDGAKRPPALAYDEISRQTLMAYRSTTGALVARMTDDDTSTPLTIITDGVDGDNVTAALAADRENGGWIAAWTPSDGGADYRAVAPAGSLRGDVGELDQTALTTLALTCSRPRAFVELLFNEDAGATVFADSSGNGHDATCLEACPQSGVSGRSGNAVSFNGPNKEALTVGDIDLTDRSFTLSSWVKYRAGDLAGPVLTLGDRNSTDGSIYFGVSSGGSPATYSLNCEISFAISPPLIAPIPDDDWHHWACTFDAPNRQLTLYLDGVEVGTRTASRTFSGINPLNIGTVLIGGESSFFFTGSLDTSAIFDRALSADEIEAVAQGALAAYSLDEPPGAETFVNVIGNGLNGRCDSTTTCPTLGVPGAAFTAAAFDGQDDWFVIGTETNSLVLANSSFTISAWAKRGTINQNQMIVSQGETGNSQGLQFGFRGNAFTCSFWGNDLNTTPIYTSTDWHHWTCTYDAQSRRRILYRDGKAVRQDTASANYSGVGPTYIGTRFDEVWPFEGVIDEVGIWQTTLTATQVQALFNKVKVIDESVLTCQMPTATGDMLTLNDLVLRQTTTRLGEVGQQVNRSLTIDADLPVATISADFFSQDGQDHYVSSPGTLIIGGDATDPTSYIAGVEVDPGAGGQLATGHETWTFAWQTDGLNDGTHTLRVQATDAVGNVSNPSNWTTILDTTPPEASISLPANVLRPYRDALGRWLLPLLGTVADPPAGAKPGSGVAGLAVLLRGGTDVAGLGWQAATFGSDGAWQLDYILPEFTNENRSLPDPSGTYTVTVRATDKISNTMSEVNHATALFEIDVTAPVVAPSLTLSNTERIVTAFTLDGTVVDNQSSGQAVTRVEVNLTPGEQISALDGTLLHLPFDETHATEYFADQSGASNAATCMGGNCPLVDQPGQRDRAITLDGTIDFLTVENLALDVRSFTLAAWVKRTSTGRDDFIFSQGQEALNSALNFAYLESDQLQCGFWNNVVTTTEKFTDTEWHHVTCLYDATTGTIRIYRDGLQLIDRSVEGDYVGTGDLHVGRRFDNSRYLSGSVDEVAIYDRTLADYEVANLYEYGRGNWAVAQLDGERWRYAITEGEDGLEGIYQLNVRGIDALDNVTPQSGQRVWRGEIDTRPPSVAFPVTTHTVGQVTSTTYECNATDFNLDGDMGCRVRGPLPPYRVSDEVMTTYDEVNLWYATTITDTSRLYAIDASRTLSRTVNNVDKATVEACDIYGHCTTAGPELMPGPLAPVDGEVLVPSAHTVFTAIEAVTVTGVAYAETGLKALNVRVNGAQVFADYWETSDVTESIWSFQWRPPGEGIYEFVPRIDEWVGETEDVVEFQDLPLHIYLPMIAESPSLEQTQFYFPLIEKAVVGYTGTTNTIYVDLEPPTIGVEPTLLTSDNLIGDQVIDLSGPIYDTVLLHEAAVRIDDGPWLQAGIDENGRWSYPWVLDPPTDGETFVISARAVDIAGRSTTAISQVTVDFVTPTPGSMAFSYTTGVGDTFPVAPGDTVDATALQVRWDAAVDANGTTLYEVGFSQTIDIDPDDLTRFDGAGSLAQPVSNGQRWYATVQVTDEVGNRNSATIGPVYIGNIEPFR